MDKIVKYFIKIDDLTEFELTSAISIDDAKTQAKKYRHLKPKKIMLIIRTYTVTAEDKLFLA